MNSKDVHILRAALLAVILGGTTGQAMADGEAARRLTPVQTSVANAVPAKTDIKLDVWLDRPDALYLDGEAVTLHLRTDTDAYITVMNVDASGTTTVIFPNPYTKENRLAANSTAKIPADGANWKLQVSPPYGGNLIKVVAKSTPEPLLPSTTLRSAGIFSDVVGGAATVSRQLTVVPTTAAVKWGVASKTFGVVANRPTDAVAQPASASPTAQPTNQVAASIPGVTAASTLPSTPTAATSVPANAPAPINLPPSDFGLILEAEKTTFVTGERIRLRATAEKSCSLVLLDVKADGSYSMILPHVANKDVWLTGGKVEFVTGVDSKHDIVASGVGTHTFVGLCSARRTLGQFLFGKSSARTAAVAKPLTLDEVLAKQPKGDAARTLLTYSVNP